MTLFAMRALLAVIFAVAGLGKLADPTGSRETLTSFGVPASLAGPLGIFLPLLELGVAAALVLSATAWLGAMGALALLLLFVLAIGVNLLLGRTPDCHCFGRLHSGPASWSTLARNAVFALLAACILWLEWNDAFPSAAGLLGRMRPFQAPGLILGLAALVFLAAVLCLLVRLVSQNIRMLQRFDALEARLHNDNSAATPMGTVAPQPGLPVGSPAPDFNLESVHGEMLTLDALRAAGKPVLLVFWSPGCGPCVALLPDIGRWQRDLAATATLAVISAGGPEENRAKITKHGLAHVVLQQDYEIAHAYHVPATPAAVLVESNGTIGSSTALGGGAVRTLVARLEPAIAARRPLSWGTVPSSGR